MSLDPYAPCLCGSGKKLKFCCADLAGELDKVGKMLEGDQRAACLQHIQHLERKYPDRASLLGLRATLELELDRPDDARATVQRFLQQHPNSPVAHACEALMLAATSGGRDAVRPLQRALAVIEDEIPDQVYEALGVVGQALLLQGELISARMHLLLQAHLADEEDTRAVELLMQLLLNREIPLLLKDEMRLEDCPDDARWKARFHEAMSDVGRGNWLRAESTFRDLVNVSHDAPAVWKNLGMVRAFLANHAGAVEALRKYAALDVPLDDAVEAEALAQLLDTATDDETVDLVQFEYRVDDIDHCRAAFSAHRQAVRAAVPPPDGDQHDEPPPLDAFIVLDRPLPAGGKDIQLSEVPRATGQVQLYGRETDRPARFHLLAFRSEALAQAQATLAEVTGQELGPPEDETVLDRASGATERTLRNWVFPSDTPTALRKALLAEGRRDDLLHHWTQTPSPILEGRTPADAAQDERFHTAIRAMILLMQSVPHELSAADFGDLRAQLGLSEPSPIEPSEVDLSDLPLVRIGRVRAEKLEDDDLMSLFRRAQMAHATKASHHLAAEIVARGDRISNSSWRADAFGVVADQTADAEARRALIRQARDIAEKAGQSTAGWDLKELRLCLALNDVAEAQTLVAHIQAAHRGERGVMQALAQVLVAAGILRPDGRPAAAPAPVASTDTIEAQASGQTEKGSGIWTPDQNRGGEKKAELWTPGSGS